MTWKIGLSAELVRKITEQDVEHFAKLSGDNNPIHMKEMKSKDGFWEKPIVHGMFIGGLVSNVIGTQMPGEGTIYMEQNMQFVKPVFVDDKVRVVVEVSDIIKPQKGILRLNTTVYNQKEECVMEGYAVVKVPVKSDDEENK